MRLTLSAPVCCRPSDPSIDETEAEQLAGVLKALSDPVRLRLINLISRSGEVCACDLPAILERSQPTISHHLKVLVEAGLVEREQRGKWAWFQLRPEQFEAVSSALALPQPEPSISPRRDQAGR